MNDTYRSASLVHYYTCYKIVVIENGHIVETGTHRELIAKQGAYEHLYSIQNL